MKIPNEQARVDSGKEKLKLHRDYDQVLNLIGADLGRFSNVTLHMQERWGLGGAPRENHKEIMLYLAYSTGALGFFSLIPN